jgi:hypothetical protein
LNTSDSQNEKSVALYWDFENLHASLVEARLGEGAYNKPDGRFKAQEPLIDVQAIVDVASSFGPLAINRAYCNWQYFGRYRDALLQAGVELIQLFSPGASAKNGADIRLCLDAVEDIGRFAHIGTVMVVGGDSDFMPVSQKIKAAGRILVGVGARKNTNRHWARSCHEFRYYENLLQLAASSSSPDAASQPADIVRRALLLMTDARGEAWVSIDALWHMVKRLDSTFDVKEQGYPNFSTLISTLDALVEIRQGDRDRVIRLR